MALIGSDLEKIDKMPGGRILLARRKELIKAIKDDEAVLAIALKEMSKDSGSIIQRIALNQEELKFVNHKIYDLRGELIDGTDKTVSV